MNLDELMANAVAALDELWQDPAETAVEHRRLLRRMRGEELWEEVAQTAQAQEPSPSAVTPVDEGLAGLAWAVAELAEAAALSRTLPRAAQAPHAAEAGTATQEAGRSEQGWYGGLHAVAAGLVEVRFVDGEAQVRAPREPNGPVLLFNRSEWDAFLRGVREGEFQTE